MSNVLQFPAARRRTEASFVSTRQRPTEPLTETARNQRLREERQKVWDRAETATRYWRAKIEYDYICPLAAKHSIIPTPALHAVDDQGFNVRNWREAQVAQLLTPAPTMAAITWKRQAFASGEYWHIGADAAELERAIDLDAAWLAAHPTKRTNSEQVARRREFKEAMRRRIREVAASRDLSDEEIKSALTLKHREIAHFSEEHGVNLEWLLEGKGRIFAVVACEPEIAS